MGNLPESWTSDKLDKLVKYKKGNKPKDLYNEQKENTVPYIDIKAFEKNIIERYADKNKSKLTKDGNILVVWDGARSGLAGRATYEGAIGSTLVDMEPLGVETEYLYRFLQTQYDYINSNPRGTGIPHVDPNIFWNIEVPLAPLPEQKRIVKKLEKLLAEVETAQERLEKIPKILKRFRQSVLMHAVTGELTKDWRERNPGVESAEELLKRIEKKKANLKAKKIKQVALSSNFDNMTLPEIPDTWAWSNLQNLGELSRGKSKHRPRNAPELFGGDYPFIQTGDVARSCGFITSHKQTYSEIGLAQSRLFPANTLCITIAANIADTGILTYPACFPDSVVGFIPEEGMFEVLFAMYFIQVMQNDIETFAPATAQKNINLEILQSISVPVPPLIEQQEIVKRVKELFKKADRIEERYKKAKTYTDKLTQSILNKAFKGELVPQDPNDEPAEVLLERVKAGKGKELCQKS